MKIIRSTKDLPKEFDIEKYEGMDKLKPYEWYYLLQARREALYKIEENTQDLKEYFKQILNSPLDTSIYSLINEEDHEIYNSDLCDLRESQAISDYTIFDFMTMELLMARARKAINIEENKYPVSSHAISFMDFYSESQRHKEEKRCATKDELFNETEFLRVTGTLLQNRVPVFINPFLNNQQIIDDLMLYLEKLREKLKIEENEIISINKYELLKWASYKILPIIDLIIWSRIYDYKITHSVLSVAVHTTGEYGEDNLRKSILPIINKILSDDFSLMSVLYSFAGHEIGKNPDSFFPEKRGLQKNWKEYVVEIVGRQLKENEQESFNSYEFLQTHKK